MRMRMRMRIMTGQSFQRAIVFFAIGIAPCAAASVSCAQAPGAKVDSRSVAATSATGANAAIGTSNRGTHNMSDYKKPSDAELKQKLDPLQYQVTQHEATERPFQNALWDNHEPGIYV